MKRVLVLVLSTFFLLPITAYSQGYVGATVGQSDYGSGIENGTSYSALGGYRFNKYFAIEAAYIDYGDADDDIAPIWTLKVDALDIAALGILPITEQFELFAKVGFSSWDVEVFEQGFGKILGLDGEDVNYGAGVAFNFTDNFSMSAGYQRYKFKFAGESAEIDNIYVGAKYYFGQSSSKRAVAPPTVQPVTQPVAASGAQLRAKTESEKDLCRFVDTISAGSGGPGDASYHADSAMSKALQQAAAAGADSYYVVNAEATAQGASVVIEALDCN